MRGDAATGGPPRTSHLRSSLGVSSPSRPGGPPAPALTPGAASLPHCRLGAGTSEAGGHDAARCAPGTLAGGPLRPVRLSRAARASRALRPALRSSPAEAARYLRAVQVQPSPPAPRPAGSRSFTGLAPLRTCTRPVLCSDASPWGWNGCFRGQRPWATPC